MRKEEKQEMINNIAELIKGNPHFYLADTADLDAANTYKLRKMCFEKQIELVVVKNTLLRKALEQLGDKYNVLHDVLKGPTSIMFCESGSMPAKLIKEFRKEHNKPILKGAFVEESIYIGDNQLELLVQLKSKNELIADVVFLLQSPVRNLISALNSGGNDLSGILKTLSEKIIN